jgi:hypothetical protein
MKNLTVGFIISLILHISILFVVFRSRKPQGPPIHDAAISLYPESFWAVGNVVQSRPNANAVEKRTGLSQTGPSERTESFSSASGSTAFQYGTETGIIGTPVPKPLIPLRSPFVRHGTLGKAKTDSLVGSRVSEWFSSQDFSRISAFPDAVGNQLHKRATGSDAFGPAPQVLNASPPKEEKNKVQFDFLPTETHVQAMAALYKKGKATQKDLYLELDPSIPITAELFNRDLDLLVQKGFMTRKKISPENIFGIATPFGVIPIEMSRKNKLNPVYQYKCQVDRAKLLAFLQSNQFLLKEKMKKASPADSVLLRSLIGRCEKEMETLAK